ncbi:unnamed protein product [Calypogeia fissa]
MKMEMEETVEEYPFFADMERRRIAALENFFRSNPDYKPLQDIDLQQSGGKRGGGRKSVTPIVIKRRTLDKHNKWDLETTVELLEAMKVYARANNFAGMGKSLERWKAVATKLSNPNGLELDILARSSMSKVQEIRRCQKKGRLVESEIQQRLFDIDETLKLHRARRSSKQ